MKNFLLIATSLLLILGAAACGALPGAFGGACALNDLPYPRPEPDYDAKRDRDISQFEEALAELTGERVQALDNMLAGKTILEIQQLFESGDLSSEELVTYYIDRIGRYDIDRLNSVMELNPEALTIARSLDQERANGNVRGDMHGIPILLKDNIATGDGMHATAGAVALADWRPDRDAFLVQQLRENGAIILGKANLSEWANWMDSCMPNGFSALGGQTQNPYGPYETYGSSSGSAVSVAANLVTASVGSETQGSMILPASINSVVAIKTSKGLVSGDNIIPLLPFQDVAGPVGRNVTDVAVLLTAMAGTDENDPTTQNAASLSGVDFTQFLAQDARQGIKVGIVAGSETSEPLSQAFTAAGMEIVEVDAADVPKQLDVRKALAHGYKLAINEFLPGLDDAVAVNSLEEIISFNKEDPDNRIPYEQDHLEASLASDLSDEEWSTLREGSISGAQEGLRSLFEKYDIDVIVTNHTQAYAPAGFPAITVPAGYGEDGQPLWTIMIADFLGEPALISAAYAYEQATLARVEPDLEATMKLIESIEGSDE